MTSLSNPVLEAFLSVLDEGERQILRRKPRETQEALAEQWQDVVKIELGDNASVLDPAMMTMERDKVQELARRMVLDSE
ncbi:hypothetical protein ABT063_35245 [Streptomyces sp. NPDC002838]|uniref:hypothetical protein n=1 Tax=Streptomyces sp. NPDC002838 TaxID=3154436 RepID=UPI0033347EBB